MVKMLKQQRGQGRPRPFIPLRTEPGDGIDLHKDPSRPNRRPNRRREPRPASDRDRRLQFPQMGKVQEDLVPVGWGFYRTPTHEPFHPHDCNRWPNSPNCKLLSPNFADLASVGDALDGGLAIEIVADECNIGISVQPGIGIGAFGLSGPQYQLVWRREECRRAKTLPTPNYPLPEDPGQWRGRDMLDDYDEHDLLHVFSNTNYFRTGDNLREILSGFSCQEKIEVPNIGLADIVIRYTSNWVWDSGSSSTHVTSAFRSNSYSIVDSYYPGAPGYGDYIGESFTIYRSKPGGAAVATKKSWIGYFDYWLSQGVLASIVKVYPFAKCDRAPYPPVPPPFPFPSPIGRPTPMPCSCPSPRTQRAILQKLDEINNKLGDWEINVEIADALPLKEGKQPWAKTIPTLAEAIAEIWEKSAETNRERNVYREGFYREMLAIRDTYQVALQNTQKLDALITFFQLYTEYHPDIINLAFDPFDLWREPSDLLKNTEFEVNKIIFDPEHEKNKENSSLKEIAKNVKDIKKATGDGIFELQDSEIKIESITHFLNHLFENIDTIKKAIGDGIFEVPETLISTPENPLPGNIKIDNLSDFQGYLLERLDELFGEWNIPIEIEDSDPTTEGNQVETKRLFNLAEAIAEIYGLLFNTWINTELSTSMESRTLIQGGQNLQQDYQTYKMVEALLEWTGIGTRTRKEAFPLLFNPESGDDPAEFLESYELQTSVVEYKPNKKETLQDDLLDIRHGTAIVRAVFWARAGVDAGKTAWDICQNLVKNKQSINNKEKDKKEDFTTWLNNAERGFSNLPRATQSTNPWGTTFKNRPKITDISENPEGGED